MFWLIRFILFWLAWLVLADKSRWREFLPTCLLAALMGSLTDVLIEHYPLWWYANSVWVQWSDDLSVYPVVVYLFLQWLPHTRRTVPLLLYWLSWTTFSILLECLHLYLGYMSYPTGEWTLLYSYIADWILFYIFYHFYQLQTFPRIYFN